MRSANEGLNLLSILFSKAVWFLKLYISQYKELLIFIAVFVVLYIFFMHWLNVRFLNRLRQPAALISLAVELGAIVVLRWPSGKRERSVCMSWSLSGPIKPGYSGKMLRWGWRS